MTPSVPGTLNRYSDGAGPRAAVLIRTAQYFKLGRNDSSWGFLVLSIRRSYLRKPSHRPVNILPNARREVSSGLRCPALRPFCKLTQKSEITAYRWVPPDDEER
jgi:hypothetical protein